MRVALVTGASRGLGREVALVLAGRGHAVFVNYLSAEREAAEVVRKAGSDAVAIKADVADPGQVQAMADRISREAGRLDVIVNNAGITKDNLLLRQSEKEWDLLIRTNLSGCFHVIRSLAPLMVKSGGGHIVNISSRSGLIGKAGQAAYSAAKAALLGVTRTSAAELAPYNIRVNAVLPGYMKTEMGTSAEKSIEAAKEASLLKRLSDTAEVADFIAYLVGTESVTGQVFSLDSRAR
ncbi:MAG: SDR family oxidoreductase [Nitrospiraceae bacterium]|nr:SDR family oxidoreductase [Nitrospiraceae bacterium]